MGKLRYRAEPSLRLPTDAVAGMDVEVTVRAWVAEDGAGSPHENGDDGLPLEVSVLESTSGSESVRGTGSVVLGLRLKPGRGSKLRVDIGPVDELYGVGLAVQVAAAQAEGNAG